jgi:hypothetical protein
MAHEVTIKIRAFPYYEDVKDPVSEKTVKQEKIARRGETVSLSDADYERAVRFDAIAEPTEGASVSSSTDQPTPSLDDFDPETANVATLSLWLKGELEGQDGKPVVEDVVDAANDEPEVAQRLIEAENHATGQQPRTTLIAELQEIVTRDTSGASN